MADESWTRADWARWLVHRDEPDEAARVLEPGDEIALGRSDSFNLAAALDRQGLASRYDGDQGRLAVVGAASPRRPPVRAPSPAPAAASKKTA